MITEVLKLEVGDVHEKWRVKVESKFYFMLFRKWWDHFGLAGNGIVVGHQGIHGITIKKEIKTLYPDIKLIQSVDLKDADIIWNICQPKYQNSFDFIICQAVLEHVMDPVGAVMNMARALKADGMLYIHTHGPRKKIHRYPIDCWRFLPDSFTVMGEISQLKIIDSVIGPEECFVVYGKSSKQRSLVSLQ